jgi:pimeloyl-ACP methyl ester carboxylesterase
MTDGQVTAQDDQVGEPLIMVVPGLAVRSYVQAEADALAGAGYRVDLLPAPAWRGQPADLRDYGQELAKRIDSDGRPVDLLIGLSAGTQAAAVAARSRLVRRLLLVGPTMDPDHRTRLRTIRSWMSGENHPDSPDLSRQARDWLKAGLPRLYRGLTSTITVALEDVLPQVHADTTIVHSDSDVISPLDYALELAATNGARFLVMPDAPHSWPIGDPARFIELVDELLGKAAGR